ncbi:MAG: LuxR C-terminal-related transcriptional regulator [Sediminibacterium sp.]|nr:LuxR C-terminal-related transcriptional regulator [Sediminibacterium sp.]
MNVLQEALMAIVANQPYVDDLLKYDVANRENLIRKRKLAKNQLFQEYSFNTREREVMGLVVSSISYQTIGEILNISPKTVETITHGLAKKIGVSNNRPELVLQSLRLGITKMMQKID